MIGAFISDDFYFFFEEKDIEKLKQTGQINGLFAYPKNILPARICCVKIIVPVFKRNKKYKATEIKIPISENEKLAFLEITEEDFDEWFIHPSDFVREHGPNWRFASSNVYITRECASNSLIRKNEILRAINEAELNI